MAVFFRKRGFPVGRLEKGRLSVARCLRLMDMGCRNIYLTDSEGRFAGEAMDRESVREAFLEKDGERIWEACPTKIGSISGDAFEGLSKEIQNERLGERIEEFPRQEEFPVVDGDGQILYVIEKVEDAVKVDWEKATFPEEFRSFGKLYLSSLGHDNLLGFYMRYRKEMPMDVLTEENLREAFSGDGAIVYNEDFFPDCRKVSIVEAVRRQERIDQEKARRQAAEEAARKRAEELRGITDATAYFRALGKHKEHFLVCVAVKDTFFQIPLETAKAMADLGMEHLYRPGAPGKVYPRCWQGYLFVMDGGKVILNRLADIHVSLFEELETSGIDLQLVSRPYEQGNAAKIILDDRDLSVNARGLNVVVLDVGSRTVVDSVGFDFYHPDKGRKPCRRLTEGIGSVLPPRKPGAPRAIDKEIKRILPIVHIAKEWASIREDRLLDMSQLIEKFDEGYHSVSIVDAEGRFLRLVNRYQFAADFPRRDYRTQTDLYVEHEEDEERLKWKLARMFLGTPRKEIPILKDGKIVGLGRYSLYFDSEGRWLDQQVFRFCWEWIDEGVAKEYFANRRRILISSHQGHLRGFQEAFGDWLDITVYEDCVLGSAVTGDFDLMLCGEDVFSSFPMERRIAYQIFFILLAETVRRWLVQRGVVVHFFNHRGTVPDIGKRVDKQGELLGGTQRFLRAGEQRYFIADGSDYDRIVDMDKRMPNFHGGRRCTTEAKIYDGNGIYFFGPCIAVGVGSYSPDKSIESYLQVKLNAAELNYHVVNCGNEGLLGVMNGINWLCRLMDTPLRFGDQVVVFVPPGFWHDEKRFLPAMYHSLVAPFLAKDNLDKKCFVDSILAHLNPRGAEIAAEYIFRTIRKDLQDRDWKDTERVSFSSLHPSPLEESSNLGRWLTKLPKCAHGKRKRCGAIVLQADPFTTGHAHLLAEAMNVCEFLYVFLLAGEKSLLPAEQRKEILESYANGKAMTVVPALGYCMRHFLHYNMNLKVVISGSEKPFDPVADTYTFARYIAPRLGITKRFFGEEPFDDIKRRYNILKREMLEEEGIEYVEIPRIKLPDGRDIITAEVREIWKKEGWRACMDYLPEETVRVLEEQDAAEKRR